MYTGCVDPRLIDDPVQVYLREVSAVPALTQAEETALSQHVLANDQQADSASKTLVEANLAMVVSIAERYAGGSIHILDLIQTGNLALMRAVNTFPDHSNQRFSVHAAACVTAAIHKAIAESRAAPQST